MKSVVLLLLISWPCAGAFCQKAATSIELDEALQRYVTLADSLDAKKLKPSGYRIQLASAAGPAARAAALKVQADFLQAYPTVRTYTRWISPNWVVQVGDFRTRLEAVEQHELLKAQFPAAFIVKDQIAAVGVE